LEVPLEEDDSSLVMPIEDDASDIGTDPYDVGSGEYIGGLSLIIERVEMRL